MERFINKIDGSEHKLDLSTFLRIRKIPVERYLSDNQITSSEELEIFLTHLDESSHFIVSDAFKSESRQLFCIINQKEQTNEEVSIDTDQEQTESIAEPNIKLKKKKS